MQETSVRSPIWTGVIRYQKYFGRPDFRLDVFHPTPKPNTGMIQDSGDWRDGCASAKNMHLISLSADKPVQTRTQFFSDVL